MEPGPVTFRPDVDVVYMTKFMAENGLESAPVTTPCGILTGVALKDDLDQGPEPNAVVSSWISSRNSRSEPSVSSIGQEVPLLPNPTIVHLVAERDKVPPSYDDFGMKLWGRNVDFLREERFARAYKAGMESGHKFRWPGTSVNIELPWRTHIACWAAMHAAQLPGDFVECGVNTGVLSLAVCTYIEFNSTAKHFYLFDTFSGVPESQMSETERPSCTFTNDMFYEECFELAMSNFRRFPNAHLVQGVVPDSLYQVDIDQVCYLSIDMNIVEPEVAAMEYFWPKLVRGAVVLLDDYGVDLHAEQKAGLDEFANRHNVAIGVLPTGQGLLLKP